MPYPGDGQDDDDYKNECRNCTVHSGFYASWLLTRPLIKPLVKAALAQNPGYELVFVGHSLGGAVAALGALEFSSIGYSPHVATFGEPRVGNDAFVRYLDETFSLHNTSAGTECELDKNNEKSSFRRVTHVGDPVPLLPLAEWGYRSHAGEVFIEKTDLPILTGDIRYCSGDADEGCIAGTSSISVSTGIVTRYMQRMYTVVSCFGLSWWGDDDDDNDDDDDGDGNGSMWAVPARFRLWSVLFAHRDYFYRLGLCVPGGDPTGSWALS